MYSQNNEEEILLANLPENGFLLDFGAYDGKTFSNSLRLIELGWSGVLIEASPINFKSVMELHKGKTNLTLINAPVTVSGGLVKFYDSIGDGISTTNKDHKEKWETNNSVHYQEIYLSSITLEQVFGIHNKNFDFVNIDVEGENLELLKTFPFDKCMPKVICIEHDNNENKIMEIVSEYGFGIIHKNNENIILKRS
jgi:FkbM family methyltransferase